MVFNTNDFSSKTGSGTRTLYMNKDSTIFNKNCSKDKIMVLLRTETVYTQSNSTEEAAKEELSKHISKISEYINWLAGKCKKYLINYYNEYYKRKNGKEWYESLVIYTVAFIIEKGEKMGVWILCKDMYCEHDILEIKMDNEKKVSDLFYSYYNKNGELKRYWGEKKDPWYKELLEYPNGGMIYVLRSIDYYNSEKYNKAVIEINKAIKIDECAINYFIRCKIHYAHSQYENALKDINEAIKRKSDWFDARKYRFYILEHLGRIETHQQS